MVNLAISEPERSKIKEIGKKILVGKAIQNRYTD